MSLIIDTNPDGRKESGEGAKLMSPKAYREELEDHEIRLETL